MAHQSNHFGVESREIFLFREDHFRLNLIDLHFCFFARRRSVECVKISYGMCFVCEKEKKLERIGVWKRIQPKIEILGEIIENFQLLYSKPNRIGSLLGLDLSFTHPCFTLFRSFMHEKFPHPLNMGFDSIHVFGVLCVGREEGARVENWTWKWNAK